MQIGSDASSIPVGGFFSILSLCIQEHTIYPETINFYVILILRFSLLANLKLQEK